MDYFAKQTRRASLVGIITAVGLLAGARAEAVTVNTGLVNPPVPPALFPTTAEVIGATPLTTGVNLQVATNAMDQTFQAINPFDLWRFYLHTTTTGMGSAAGQTVNFQIYKVSDTNATTTPNPLDLANILLTSAFTVPAAPAGPIIEVILDNALHLDASAGTAGYGLRLLTSTFQWQRTGASAGNVYSGGTAYNNFARITDRDFVFALSSVAPPPPPPIITSVGSGDLNAAGTWSDNLVPHAGSVYHIQPGHTVTATNTTFNGNGIVVTAGGTLDLKASAVRIPNFEIQAGATLTSSAGPGDFAIGDINLPTFAPMLLNADASFAASAGADLFLDVDLAGTGALNFASNGVGSDLVLSRAGGHTGVIRFNGTGDEVQLLENEAFGTLEMNSTGVNRLRWETNGQVQGGRVIFNKPGEILHSAALNRIQGPNTLRANEPVTVDVTQTFTGDERRFFVSGDIEGTANIIVKGTSTDPTVGTLTHNEFEFRGAGELPTPLAPSTYSGTISTVDYIDLEIRREMPNARFEINDHGRLEMGYNNINSVHSFHIGEVDVKAGGRLVVGYEEVNALGETHTPQGLHLTTAGGRAGSLTLAAGSQTVLQVSGTGPHDFDRVVANGNITLGGKLRILVNPVLPAETDTVTMGPYSPTLGDTFDIFKASPVGDYNGNGTVGPEDHAVWVANFGSTSVLTADGNGDLVVDAADYVVWRNHFGQTGTISGAFEGGLEVIDPGNVMSGAGLAFQLVPTSTLIQLKVIAAGSGTGLQAIPEPSALLLAAVAACGGWAARRRR